MSSTKLRCNECGYLLSVKRVEHYWDDTTLYIESCSECGIPKSNTLVKPLLESSNNLRLERLER